MKRKGASLVCDESTGREQDSSPCPLPAGATVIQDENISACCFPPLETILAQEMGTMQISCNDCCWDATCFLPFLLAVSREVCGRSITSQAWVLHNSIEGVKCPCLGAILYRRVKTAAVFSAKIRKSYLL